MYFFHDIHPYRHRGKHEPSENVRFFFFSVILSVLKISTVRGFANPQPNPQLYQ